MTFDTTDERHDQGEQRGQAKHRRKREPDSQALACKHAQRGSATVGYVGEDANAEGAFAMKNAPTRVTDVGSAAVAKRRKRASSS
jgi:hypothetical protein